MVPIKVVPESWAGSSDAGSSVRPVKKGDLAGLRPPPPDAPSSGAARPRGKRCGKTNPS